MVLSNLCSYCDKPDFKETEYERVSQENKQKHFCHCTRKKKKKKSWEENSRSMEKINSFLNKAEKNAAVLSCDIWLHK